MICMPLLKMVKLFTWKRIPIIGNLQKMDICDKQDKKLSILNMVILDNPVIYTVQKRQF